MGRGLRYDIPGEDWRRGIDSIAGRGWEDEFAPGLTPPLRLVVEIGFGRGEFLLDLAGKNPDTAFVGVEVSFKRCLRMARRLARTGLRNVRLFEGRGQVVVEHLCGPGSVSALWINFSDPWVKDRHASRRLFQAPFVASLERALEPGGSLHVATDDTPYAHRIDSLLAAGRHLQNAFAPDPWRSEVPGRVPTAYEETWRQQRRPLYFFEYVRR